MPWGQSEGANVRQQPKLWDSQREEKKRTETQRENFPTRSSNLRHCRAAHRKKDWANTRGDLAEDQPIPRQRQGGKWATARAGRRGANLAPEMASSTKLRAGSQLLTKSSWDPGWLTSTRRVAARDHLPRRDAQHTWDGTPAAHLGNRAAGMGEVIRCTVPPGESALLTKHLVTWTARTWEGHKMQAQMSLCLCGVPENLNLSALDLGSARNPGTALDSFPAEQPGTWTV